MMPARLISRNIMIACLCLIALAGIRCRRATTRARAEQSTIVVLHPGDERIFLQDHWGMGAAHMMFLPLVAHEGDEYGEPQPVLAQRWEHSEDYRKWTLSLRKDVKWHDGVPVTAHDVKFTMDLRQHPALIGGKLDRLDRYSVEILDDFTFTVTYTKPTDALDTWSVFYPKHLLEGLDPKEFNSWDFWTRPVGNGPYRYVRHVAKTMVEVEANPDYYRGKPRIERVILKFSQQASLTELLSGNVDALMYVSLDMLLKLSGDDRFRSYHWWGSVTFAIYWNHRHPLFKNREIRRALTMAINRRELADVLNYPEGVPILDAITTRRQLQQGLYPDPLPYDPERARKLLEGEGWRDTDGDGVRERDGEEFRFTAATVGERENIAIYVQDRFRRIGVRMEIQVMDFSIIMRRLKTGEFDALIFNIPNSTNFGHARMFGENSPFGYANPEMIRLLNLAVETIDPDEKDRIYQRIIPIFTEDMPITLLLPRVSSYIVHQRIKGLSTPYRPDPVWSMEHLWLEDDD